MKAGFESTAGQPGAGPRFVPPTIKEMAKLFPHLEILELLGQGGMGAVYRARQSGLDRLVAVKILPPEKTATPGFAERFAREARALARLNHPYPSKSVPLPGTPPVFYWVFNPELTGYYLCDSERGTGVNDPQRFLPRGAPQPRYGDASAGRGNCLGQICVSDVGWLRCWLTHVG